MEAYRSQHAWKTYGMGAAFTFLAIIGLWLTLHWNNKAYAWLIKKMDSMAGSWKKEIRFKNIKVLSAARIELVLLAMLKMLRIFIVLMCLHFFLPLILSFFPETHSLSSRIFGYILTPFATIFHTAIKYIPNLFSSS